MNTFYKVNRNVRSRTQKNNHAVYTHLQTHPALQTPVLPGCARGFSEREANRYLWHQLSSETLPAQPQPAAASAHRPRAPARRGPRTRPLQHPHPPRRANSHRAGTERPPCRARAGSSLQAGRAAGRWRSRGAPAAPGGAGLGQRGRSHRDGRTASPHLSSRLRRAGPRRFSPARPPGPEPRFSSHLTQLPAPPVTYAAGARPDLLAACCIRPSAQAPRHSSPAQPPGAPDASAPPPSRSHPPRRPRPGRRAAGRAPNAAASAPCAGSAAATAHSPAELALSRAVPRLSQPARGARCLAGRGSASRGRSARQRPKPVSRTSAWRKRWGGCCPRLLFLLSLLLLFPFKKFIYLEDPPPSTDAMPRRRAGRKPVPPAPGSFAVRRGRGKRGGQRQPQPWGHEALTYQGDRPLGGWGCELIAPRKFMLHLSPRASRCGARSNPSQLSGGPAPRHLWRGSLTTAGAGDTDPAPLVQLKLKDSIFISN